MSGFSFAGLSPSEVSLVGGQLDEVGRLFQGLATLADPKKWSENARLLKAETQAALEAMAKAADAQLALDERENALNTRERALESRSQDLARKENELNARDVAISQREANWHQAVAAVRGIAA
jgi:hypothetical protein